MPIDYAAARFWLEVLIVLGNIGMFIYVWIDRGQRVGRARIEALETSVNAQLKQVCDRLTGVERDIEHAPSHADLGQIYERINAVEGGMRELKGEFAAVRRGVEMIHQFLLEKGGSK